MQIVLTPTFSLFLIFYFKKRRNWHFDIFFQAHTRAVAITRSISQINVNFFKTLDMHATELGQIVEEAQVVNDEQLSELEKKFEVIKPRI